MIKVGITGQVGFIGSHLYNTLSLEPDQYQSITFEDSYFHDLSSLQNFVTKCDVIVHLAAMNRHNDPDVIYNTNIKLVNQLIEALENTHSRPHIIFSSSTQEENDNQYGKSKKDGRLLLSKWAIQNEAPFTGMVIPNVFGPFGDPYYNSVVATFCYQLTHGEHPKIDIDSEMKLIYVGELIDQIIKRIDSSQFTNSNCNRDIVVVPHSKLIKVSMLLNLIESFKECYFEKGVFPDLNDKFTKNLFNTFVCYIDHSKWFPFFLKKHTDNRGSFVETVKLNSGGQVSFSITVPGIKRGDHFHTQKAERFAVVNGKAKIEIRQIGTREKRTFFLNGDHPSFVDMPIWHTHNITNIGDEELYTIFWTNEIFNRDDPDTYYEEV